MCYGSQDGLAALAFAVPRTKSGAQSSFEHRVDGLHLPSLPILGLVLCKPLFHASPPAARRRFVGRSSALGRDDGPNAVRPNAAMDPLGVEVRIGQQRPDPGTADGLPQCRTELDQIRARPATGYGGENHVAAAVDHEDDLRELGVSRDLIAASSGRTGPNEPREIRILRCGVVRGIARLVEGMPIFSSTGLKGERSQSRAERNAENSRLDEEMLRAGD